MRDYFKLHRLVSARLGRARTCVTLVPIRASQKGEQVISLASSGCECGAKLWFKTLSAILQVNQKTCITDFRLQCERKPAFGESCSLNLLQILIRCRTASRSSSKVNATGRLSGRAWSSRFTKRFNGVTSLLDTAVIFISLYQNRQQPHPYHPTLTRVR